ncbi:hypothetical protein FIBSPDRAFT_786901 [Athelia psychrophila]|uniref:Uncharacterized protein n=1 Tax=Athelia psychrophila TaxID=1759441 RepID=A0A166L3D1_9AGAM|nr:hypothetical protein FIBSPDRAFT_786901 [Fibularhizoctonia sp. CBS 109695]
MSSKQTSSGSGYAKDSVTGSGSNDQGNHYCTREDSAGNSGYHYSNNDGSYYYSNTDGSNYYNSGSGYAQYTSPSGQQNKSYGK